MRVQQLRWSQAEGWKPADSSPDPSKQLVLIFAAPSALFTAGLVEALGRRFPKATLFGCSTAGEIEDTQVYDETLVATAVEFEHTRVRAASEELTAFPSSAAAGGALARALVSPELRHVVVLADALHAGGNDLIEGISRAVPPKVSVTGGLAGDGPRFGDTYVLVDGKPLSKRAAALGFYGDRLEVGYGSLGGWNAFGPRRVITRSQGNTLYELDGQPALDLYKKYLGPKAAELPASGLLFPLAIFERLCEAPVVRTVLNVDEKLQSMTFAAALQQGAPAQLMRANFEQLVEGAVAAARCSSEGLDRSRTELALLISCVGRKIALGQRIEDEVEGVRQVLGEGAALTGFYSYGEYAPFRKGTPCTLHNQTMTVTTFAER